MDKLREREGESKETQRLNFNQRHNAIPLKSVQPGTPVYIKDMGTTGTVTRTAETPRSYLVKIENGTVILTILMSTQSLPTSQCRPVSWTSQFHQVLRRNNPKARQWLP